MSGVLKAVRSEIRVCGLVSRMSLVQDGNKYFWFIIWIRILVWDQITQIAVVLLGYINDL